MKYNLVYFNHLLVIPFIILTCQMVHGCDKNLTTGKTRNMPMEIYYLGRFSVAVPAGMNQERTSKVRHVKIEEKLLPKEVSNEQAYTNEWNKFLTEIKKLAPPRGTDKVILRMQDFHVVGIHAKGIFYHKNGDAADEATWALLLDTGTVGALFTGRSVLVEKENKSHLMLNNIENICRSYHVQNPKMSSPKENWFYLQHGIINLPYSWQEESNAYFEGSPLKLVLTINMEMDSRHKIEEVGHIEKMRGMLAAAALQTSGSISKIRLDKREVAGMKGEKSILRITDDGEKTLLFTWEFNGKEDSGEYPTTSIEMRAPDGNLDEKTKIWDAVLDSMKPMFERKK